MEGSNASTPPTSSRQDAHTPDWTVAEAQEFVPQGFDTPHMVNYTLRPKFAPIFTTLLKWGPFFRQEFVGIWKKQHKLIIFMSLNSRGMIFQRMFSS